jgi:hypothetical protein
LVALQNRVDVFLRFLLMVVATRTRLHWANPPTTSSAIADQRNILRLLDAGAAARLAAAAM